MLNILPVIITCQSRKDSLKATLKSFKTSDLKTKPKVFSLTMEDKIKAQLENTKQALDWANSQECDYVLFCEDDIEINKHIVFNLENWKPVKYGYALISTLYDNLQHLPGMTRDNIRQLVPSNFGESQAILIKKSFLPLILSNWETHHPKQLHGFRIYHTLFLVDQNLYMHTPSLVQHTGQISSWGNDRFFTQAKTYNKDWKVNV